MPPDVVAALKDAEFEDFLPRLEAELKSKSQPAPPIASRDQGSEAFDSPRSFADMLLRVQ